MEIIPVEIDNEFSKELDSLLTEFKELGIHTTKAELIVKFAKIGNLNEIRERGLTAKNETNGR